MNAPGLPLLVGCAIVPTRFSRYTSEARGTDDDDFLDKTYSENWILITNDKDFGEKVYRENKSHCGIIFLRLQDERAASKIDAVEKLLDGYEDQFAGAFVVVTETQVRFGQA